MSQAMMDGRQHRIGFVSTRLAGTDGVSLETAKWSSILMEMGHECFFFAGESDRPEDRTFLVPEAHFQHPDIQALSTSLFNGYTRSSTTSGQVHALRYYLKEKLHEFVQTFDLELLVVENALSLPMNVPLGLGMTELIAETGIPTIGHHHDFWWERKRFAVSAAADYLRAAFPPTLPSIHHVVINSFGARQLALRTGDSSTLIPNVMDFESPPPEPDAHASRVRSALGISSDEHLVLQPTRIVPRKRIEHAIELVHRLDSNCVLVVSHASGDEGHTYAEYLSEYADIMGVRMLSASDNIDYERGQTPDGRDIFSLADIYQQADLVTYPSSVEGFGNAFLETVYYCRPIVINTYEIFKTDIQPKGFKVIGFDDFIGGGCVRFARRVLHHPELAAEMTDYNYQLGRRYYSYSVLKNHLVALMSECLGSTDS